MRRMRIRVALLPRQIDHVRGDTCVVIDVMRFSTCVVALFEDGCPEVYVCGDLEVGRGWRERLGPGALLCGEIRGGLRGPGCDYAPSPAEVAGLDLRERRVVVSSVNGAEVILFCLRGGAERVLVGCLANLSAVSRAAFEAARVSSGDITLVCSGRNGSEFITLDDVYGAGRIAREVERLAEAAGVALEVDDSALAAGCVVDAYPDPARALAVSSTATLLRRIDRQDDIDFCGHVDTSANVPEVVAQGATVRPACPLLVPQSWEA